MATELDSNAPVGATVPMAAPVISGAARTALVNRMDNVVKENPTNPYLAQVESLEVVDAATYQVADHCLGRIIEERGKLRADLLRPIDEAKAALKKLTALFDRVDGPWKTAEVTLRRRMAVYKTAEARRLVEEKAAREREARHQMEEADRARREAEEIARRARMQVAHAEQVRLQQEAKLRLEESRYHVEEAYKAAAESTPRPTAAINTTTRTVRRWRIVDLNEFLLAIANQEVPAHMAEPNASNINAHFAIAPKEVAAWPGVEVYEEVVIVRK